ncbi:MAG TPA: trehalose-phosphatase [Proteobacteria bacterium]|nr:trehalose-phosphate phosphatase [bacterium BMS3Abin14]HDL53282.1 trehalose-phosphatase [Pseudomonadota bacterium]
MSHRPLPPPGEKFWKHIEAAPSKLLFLDYDGTLAPFRENRHEAIPYPGVREVLEKILESGGCRVVLISGRWTKDLPPLLGLKKLPEIWGSHGLERFFPNGHYEVAALSDKEVRGLAEAKDLVNKAGLGHHSEQKPGCLALHWRGLDENARDRLISRIEDKLAPLARKTGLVLKEFDGGLELRSPGRNKGDAVRTVLSEEGLETVCAYLGDDLTDEDAFKAVEGRGLGILVRKQWRSTAAAAWLKPPEELIRFLERWAEVCSGVQGNGALVPECES